jgi:kynureninase
MSLDRWQSEAHERDAQDDLARFRYEFFKPPHLIYLDGNSLGLLSRSAEEAVCRVLGEWRTLAIAGWLSAAPPWIALADEIATLVASLVGAAPDEIGIGDSTTVNLHKLLATFYKPTAARPNILIDEFAFPSDRYAVISHVRLHGLPADNVVTVPGNNRHSLDECDIIRAMTGDIQMAVLSTVLYRSGQRLDIGRLARAARERDIVLALDCSHSVGIMPHQLDAAEVDCAFWCTYKYLNGGPGSVAAWYLNRRHFGRAPGLAGWFGSRKERQFDMAPAFDPAPDARCLQIGTPPILSMAPLLGTLRTIAEAGIDRLRTKSLALTAFLTRMAEHRLKRHGFQVIGPYEDERRGGHIALGHPEAMRVSKALRDADVIADHRPPDLIRLAPSPLYTSFADCCEAVARLETIMTGAAYTRYASERDLIS